ncbi:MAG: hypothetical protein ACRD50_08410 [Candidatus Acidiferrales bacterium]
MQILEEGQQIKHDQYGLGIVRESNTERTTVDFDDFGTKKFVTSIWQAETIGDPVKGARPRRRGRKPKTQAK